MATYVLVPGGWDGGWAWQGVAARLRAAGHQAYPLTLTGLGERAHLASPAIGLDTHIQDVLGVLTCEELREVILVGHSYGGAVITGVADRAADRLAHLVYVDAFVPQDGQSLADILGPAVMARLVAVARVEGEGWQIPPSPETNRSPFHRGRQTAQPVKTLTQPVTAQDPAAAALPRTYIACTDKPALPLFAGLTAAAARARAAGWRYCELPTGHMPVWTMPQELAALLLDLA